MHNEHVTVASVDHSLHDKIPFFKLNNLNFKMDII